MHTFVLVHGAWHGSWSWKRVRDLLIAQGHRVFTPTLSGVGERTHLLSPDIGLETHVSDILNLLRFEELDNVVLVGHSYGGVVAQHVVDRMPERIAVLLFLDAFVLEHGRSVTSYLPDNGAKHREGAHASGDGWRVPPIPAAAFEVNPADVAWVDRQCTPMPLKALEDPARLTGLWQTHPAIGYIKAKRRAAGAFEQFHQYAIDRGWWVRDLACGHDIPIDMPHECVDLLLEFAGSDRHGNR